MREREKEARRRVGVFHEKSSTYLRREGQTKNGTSTLAARMKNARNPKLSYTTEMRYYY
jgi:hypothetical protein